MTSPFIHSATGLVPFLNTIYFISSAQKAHRTYKRVLEGTDVGIYGLTW